MAVFRSALMIARGSEYQRTFTRSLGLVFMVMSLFLTTTVLVQCGGDDDDDNGSQTPTPTPTRTMTPTATMTPTPGYAGPTWEGEIKELMAIRCATCHMNPPQKGAPEGFRFDKYNRDEGSDGWDGAYEKRDRILVRAVQDQTMPPTGPIVEAERELLREWIEAGAPRD